MRLPPASLVPTYLCAQAIAIAAWWCVLWCWPASRAPFVPPGAGEATLFAFCLPDALVLVFGSLACAHGLRCERPWARPMLWLLAGASFYGTLWCVGASLATGGGWPSTLLMLPCSAGAAWTLAVAGRR